MRVGVVIVHYRTPELARSAVAALRASTGVGPDLVVVDNGSDDAGREVLDSLGVRVVRPADNLGYAGGLNLGVRELAEDAPDVLVLMNPDVRVEQGCLAELVRALGTGAGVAGPRCLWSDGRGSGEDGHHVLLPPGDPVGRRHELARYLAASRGGAWARRARATWRSHAQRHWTASEDLPSHTLSGALLAVTIDAWHRVGPFDEGYRLYFEETDWLRRAAAKGVGALHVPSARAHHGYARSTPAEPRAAQWFADSEQRFRSRWHGRTFTSVLATMARRSPPRPGEVEDGAAGEPEADERTRWIEISASPLGLPSGGLYLPAGCADGADPLPAMVRQRASEMPLYWRTVDADSRESGSRLIA